MERDWKDTVVLMKVVEVNYVTERRKNTKIILWNKPFWRKFHHKKRLLVMNVFLSVLGVAR